MRRCRLGTALAFLTIALPACASGPAESFCRHADTFAETMIEVGTLDPLTASEAEELVAFQPRFAEDARELAEEGLMESARVARVWADALESVRGAKSQAERDGAYDKLRRVVRELYGSAGTCPNIR